jgi:hypothetical protein
MKNIFLAFSLLTCFSLFGQAPEAFKYQSILRDVNGAEISNQTVSLRISVHDNTPNGLIIYQESHQVTTNNFGLFSLSVGLGNPLIGTFSAIDWGTNSKYVQIEADLTGGTNFISFGTSELLSVPYALYAKNATSALFPAGTSVGNTPFWDGTTWIVSSNNIFNNNGKVGIGTDLPYKKLDINGDINLALDSAYHINKKKVLSSKGNNNIFVGEDAGSVNSIGFINSFLGYKAGFSNVSGSQNTFIGGETGTSNTEGAMNSFIGRRAGNLNTTGNENTFVGAYAGQSNQDGFHNSFLGVSTGNSNTLGNENTFLGAHAGYNNNLGNNNTFVGNFAGLVNTAGTNNTFIGFYAGASSSNLTNATAIGTGAIANADNSVMIGNTDVTSIGGQVSWSTFSDRRLKHSFQESELGLNFILSLKPVSYEYKASGQAGIRYTGLIAQDVEKSLKKLNTQFSGLVRPKNKNDFYSIRYGDFVVPLIKSIQEQQEQINQLKSENEMLLERIEKLEQKLK